jgi:hypothetical protein
LTGDLFRKISDVAVLSIVLTKLGWIDLKQKNQKKLIWTEKFGTIVLGKKCFAKSALPARQLAS